MNYDRAALIAELNRDEGCRLSPYRDTTGNLTIGWGTNIETIAQEEADWLRDHRVGKTEAAVDQAFPWIGTLDPVVQRVLLEMAYNMGLGAFSTFSTFLALLREGNRSAAADDLMNTLAYRQEPARVTRWANLLKGA